MGTSITERDRRILDSAMITAIPVIDIIKGLGGDAYKLIIVEREVGEDRVKVEIRYPTDLDDKVKEITAGYSGREYSVRELCEEDLIPERDLIIQEKQGRHYVIDRETGLILLGLPRLRIIDQPVKLVNLKNYFEAEMERIGDLIVRYNVEHPESLVSTGYIRLLIVSTITGAEAVEAGKPPLTDRINAALIALTSRKGNPEINRFIGKGLVSHVLGTVSRMALKRLLLLIITRRFDNLLLVETPLLGKRELYDATGHLRHFGDRMFRVLGRSSEYILRPMNCPHHVIVMKTILSHHPNPSDLLPIATYEYGTVLRDEPAGTLEPLMRVLQFTQDDLHVLIPYPRLSEYLEALISDALFLYSLLGIGSEDLEMVAAVHDPNNPGRYLYSELGLDVKALWSRIEEEILSLGRLGEVVSSITERLGLESGINILTDKSAAFYGPKIDMFYTGGSRYLRLFTAQLDVSLPRIFGLDQLTGVKDLVLVHVAIAGSLERFMGVLLENKPTLNPVIAPVQAVIAYHEELLGDPVVADAYEAVKRSARRRGLRTLSISTGLRRIGTVKNRALLMAIPYLVVIGPREVEDKTITIQDTATGETISQFEISHIDELAEKLVDELERVIYEETRSKLSRYLARTITADQLKIAYTPPDWIMNYRG